MCRPHFNYIGTGPEINAMRLQGTHLRLQGGFKLVPIRMTNLDGHPSPGGFEHLLRHILGYNAVPIHLNLNDLF